MNAAYEYALPTNVANLMAGPCLTEHIGAHGLADPSPLRGQPGGCQGSVPWPQSPMLAASQPLDIASLRSGALHVGYDCSSGGKDGTLRGSNSAPVYSSCPGGSLQECLHAYSSHSGSTVIISPYMAAGCSARMMTRGTNSQSAIGSTSESIATWSWDDDEMPPPPPPPQRGVYGIHMGGPLDTVSTRSLAGTHEVKRRQQRQWWQRMSMPPSVRTAPGDCTVNSVRSAQHLMVRLQRQLDAFRGGDLFLRRFEMLGAQKRRCGGALRVLLNPSQVCLSGGSTFSSATTCVLKTACMQLYPLHGELLTVLPGDSHDEWRAWVCTRSHRRQPS